MTKKPNFFIVGAPKCGTTAMDRYLDRHPEICMASRKEMHHFGSDLQQPAYVRNYTEYLTYFSHCENVHAIGESSVNYLYSTKAAEEIFKFDPKSKIIIMLRNPVELVPSLHSELLWNGTEVEKSLEKVLELEASRKNGKNLPEYCPAPYGLQYTERAMFVNQIKRYQDVFPESQIHIIIYDDFKLDTEKEYKKVLDFLGVDTSFSTDFKSVNANKVVKSKVIQKFLIDKSSFLKQFSQNFLPKSLRTFLRNKVRAMNTTYVNREPLKYETEVFLKEKFREEVKELSSLLDRDLSKWIEY